MSAVHNSLSAFPKSLPVVLSFRRRTSFADLVKLAETPDAAARARCLIYAADAYRVAINECSERDLRALALAFTAKMMASADDILRALGERTLTVHSEGA